MINKKLERYLDLIYKNPQSNKNRVPLLDFQRSAIKKSLFKKKDLITA